MPRVPARILILLQGAKLQAAQNSAGAARCFGRIQRNSLFWAGQELPQTVSVLSRHRLHQKESGLCVRLAAGHPQQEPTGGATAPSIQELHRIQPSAQSY